MRIPKANVSTRLKNPENVQRNPQCQLSRIKIVLSVNSESTHSQWILCPAIISFTLSACDEPFGWTSNWSTSLPVASVAVNQPRSSLKCIWPEIQLKIEDLWGTRDSGRLGLGSDGLDRYIGLLVSYFNVSQ